jgi:hypothetical protein
VEASCLHDVSLLETNEGINYDSLTLCDNKDISIEDDDAGIHNYDEGDEISPTSAAETGDFNECQKMDSKHDVAMLTQLAHSQFQESGMITHFESVVGGSKRQRDINSILKRTTKCLFWMHNYVLKTEWDNTKHSIIHWFLNTVKFHYEHFCPYAQYLECIEGYKAGTIVNHLLDIKAAATWLVLFRRRKEGSSKIQVHRLQGLHVVLKAIQKSYIKKMKMELTGKDISNAVSHRRIPIDGLKALMECVIQNLPLIEKLYESVVIRSERIPKHLYNDVLDLLFSAMYVFSPQGRAGGITELEYGQGESLLSQGYVNCKIFKTQGCYGYQPVTLSQESALAFSFYVNYLRPRVRDGMPQAAEPLWITYDGEPIRNVGRHVTAFFQRQLGLHITTSAIRALVETKARELLDANQITAAEREAVSNVNGHSSQTVKAHYLYLDRAKDVDDSRVVFSKLRETLESPQYPNASAEQSNQFEWSTETNVQYINWGHQHPDYAKTTGRVRWTVAELKYIKDWLLINAGEGGIYEGRINICSMLHKYITRANGDETAIPIFHALHILNACKLRHGYRTVIEDK